MFINVKLYSANLMILNKASLVLKIEEYIILYNENSKKEFFFD